jgi:hypothetical protein
MSSGSFAALSKLLIPFISMSFMHVAVGIIRGAGAMVVSSAARKGGFLWAEHCAGIIYKHFSGTNGSLYTPGTPTVMPLSLYSMDGIFA